MTMPQLTDLPLDLLPNILFHLSKKEFIALPRVCKLLHKEILPYLYRDLTFKATKSRSCARKLALLLRTLLEQPHLAFHVTSLKLLGPHPCWTKYNPWAEDKKISPINFWGLEGCTTLSKAQMIFASNQFYQLVDEETHKSLAQFQGRNKDALATLVLTRFTQLTSLELGDGFLMYSLFLPHLLKRASHLLPKLEHVVFGDKTPDPENTVSYMDLDLIRPLFYHPAVKSFEWTMSQPWQFQWKQPERPRSESLRKLQLFRTNITRELLEEFLTATPQLRTFDYMQEILISRHMPAQLDQFTNLSGLDKALRKVKDTLEEVKLSLELAPGSLSSEEISEEGVQLPPIQGTLTVLREMENLRIIVVPMIMILGWFKEFAARPEEVLPSSIEEVTLTDHFVKFCPWAMGFNCFKKIGLVGDYLLERKRHAPKLRTFKLQLTSPKDNLWLEDAVTDLKAPISGQGVIHEVVREGSTTVHIWRFEDLDAIVGKSSERLPATRYTPRQQSR